MLVTTEEGEAMAMSNGKIVRKKASIEKAGKY